MIELAKNVFLADLHYYTLEIWVRTPNAHGGCLDPHWKQSAELRAHLAGRGWPGDRSVIQVAILW